MNMAAAPPANPGLFGNAVAMPMGAVSSLALHGVLAAAVIWAITPPERAPQDVPQAEMSVEAYRVPRSEAAEARPDAETAREDAASGDQIGSGTVPLDRARPAPPPLDALTAAPPPADAIPAAGAAAESLAPAPPAASAAEAATPEGTAARAAAPEAEGLRERPPPRETAAAAALPAETAASAPPPPTEIAAAAPSVAAAVAAATVVAAAAVSPAKRRGLHHTGVNPASGDCAGRKWAGNSSTEKSINAKK